MIKIGICDSNIPVITKYKSWIGFWERQKKLQLTVHTFQTPNQLLNFFTHVSDLDILIIDPCLSHGQGLAAVKKLRDLFCTAEVIYLASSNACLPAVFDTDPMYYQTRGDVTMDGFYKVFLKAFNKVTHKKLTSRVFHARSGMQITRIPYASISYFDITNRIIAIHYGDNEVFEYYSTIAAVEKEVANSSFLRIHRSIIVNLDYVTSFSSGFVVLATGETLTVGVTYLKLLLNTMNGRAAANHVLVNEA